MLTLEAIRDEQVIEVKEYAECDLPQAMRRACWWLQRNEAQRADVVYVLDADGPILQAGDL